LLCSTTLAQLSVDESSATDAGAAALPPSQLRTEQAESESAQIGAPERKQPAADLPTRGADDLGSAAATQPGAPSDAPARAARRQRLHQGLEWTFCGPRRDGAARLPSPPPPAPDTPVDVEAGALSYQQETGVLTLTGGVDVRRADERVSAERVTYDRNTAELGTGGETLLERPGVRLIGDRALLNLETNQGRIEDVSYRFHGNVNLRGTAKVAELVEPSLSRYSGIVYSTCPPGSNAWSLKASTLTLDQDKGIGVARDARLRVKGVPVLYTPYLRFPIDDRRKSGFLIPTVGSSDESGFELVVPYYWNIAPNMDATIVPHYLSERGLLLGTEFRYLTRQDRGRIEAEIIPDDAKYDDNGARWALNLEEEGNWFGRFSTYLDFSAVSDDSYLEDFGNGLDITSTRRLLQRGAVTYNGPGWSLLTAVEGYQTVDPEIAPAGRPYGRLPQVLFNLSPIELGGGLLASVNAEYDYFDHNHIVYGQRLAMQPNLSLPLHRSYGHLIPRVSLNLSGYDLSNTDPGQPTSPSHTIPTVEVDGKLVFERDAELFGQAALQTLEPRLFYLYTPYVDQSDTPVFDSSELTFNFSNLFRSNRFTGRDRIGDANQITTALTSRVLNARTGKEMLRLSVGRILYFADRRVQIDGPAEVANESPVAGELSARLFDRWRARASFEWDPQEDTEQWGRRTLQLQYTGAEAKQLVNLAYRFDRGTTIENRYETTDLSFRMPLSRQVEVVGRWLYSLENEETSDAFAGIEFGQCCWKLRVLGRHYKNRADSPANTSVMVQLELAGLGAFGSSVDSFLQREVYGYQVD
jgi:LPS-assembly protein